MKRIFNKFTGLTAVIMLAVFVSCGNLSNTSSVTPPPPTQHSLEVPTDFTATESKTKYDEIMLTWKEVEDADGYEIFQNNSKNFSTTQEPYKTLKQRTFISIEMSTPGTYYYCIRAYKQGNKREKIYSEFSVVQEYTFSQPDKNSPPKFVSAAQSDMFINYVEISWQKNGADRYYVYYNTEDDPNTATKHSYSPTDGRTLVSLSDAGIYYFWVRAVNSDGTEKGEFSQVASCEFIPSAVPTPTILSAKQETGKNSVKITWQENGAVRFQVYYNTEDNKETAKPTSTSSSLDYDVIKFKEDGTYYFWVVAEDGNGNKSEYSQSVSCSFWVIKPEAPTKVSATADNKTVTITHTKKLGFIYNFYYNTKNNPKTAKKTDLFSFELEGSGTYYFWVTATDSDGIESDFSNVAECTITY